MFATGITAHTFIKSLKQLNIKRTVHQTIQKSMVLKTIEKEESYLMQAYTLS